jgi:hypothetical protein
MLAVIKNDFAKSVQVILAEAGCTLHIPAEMPTITTGANRQRWMKKRLGRRSMLLIRNVTPTTRSSHCEIVVDQQATHRLDLFSALPSAPSDFSACLAIEQVALWKIGR